MKKKTKDMKIRQRLNEAFNTIIMRVSVVTIIAVVIILYMSNRFDYTLSYYAFPQGDVGLAMNEFAEIGSATRAVIGYEEQHMIDAVMADHTVAKERLYELLKEVEKTMVTPEGKASYADMEEKLENYFEIEEQVLAIGATTDQELSRQAQEMAYGELAEAYKAADATFTALMDVNIQKGDQMQKTLNILGIAAIIVSIVMLVISIVSAKLIGNSIATGIEEPLLKMGERFRTFSQGEFHEPFPTVENKDEIADMIGEAQNMADRLSTIIIDAIELLSEMAEGNYNINT